jgi:transcriptional regulator with XRE-family HTH domain
MLSETLTTALEGYAVGPKVRRLRLRKKLGLVQLGEHTGLSPALLSKIERDGPPPPTLRRAASQAAATTPPSTKPSIQKD